MVLYKRRLYSLSLSLVYFIVRILSKVTSIRFVVATRSASGAIRYRLSVKSSSSLLLVTASDRFLARLEV